MKLAEEKYIATLKNKVRTSDVADEIEQACYTFCFKERERFTGRVVIFVRKSVQLQPALHHSCIYDICFCDILLN